MAEPWKPASVEVYKDWIQKCIDEQDNLTQWELKFVADMERILRSGFRLTEAQAKKLEQIYADKTS